MRGRSRDYLRDIKDGDVNSLTGTITQLLRKLYSPLIRAYPFGPVDNRAVSGLPIFDAMMAANPVFANAHHFLNNLPKEVVKLMLSDNVSRNNETTKVVVQVWLNSEALVWATPTLRLNSISVPTQRANLEAPILSDHSKRTAIRQIYTQKKIPGIRNYDALEEHTESGTRHYLSVGSLARPLADITTSADMSPEIMVPMRSIFTFTAPFCMDDKEQFMMLSRMRWGGAPPVAEVSGSCKAVDPRQCFWLLPGNPYYEKVMRWAETAYAFQHIITQHINTLYFIVQNCTTLGQMRRVWPEIINFVDGAALYKLKNAQKASPLPAFMQRTVLGGYDAEEHQPAFKERVRRIQQQINELTEACTRALILPQLTVAEAEFYPTFRTESYWDGTMPDSVWNKFSN